MMNGSLNDTDTVQDGRMDNFTMGVGIGYICTGIIFIFLQLACAYLIMKNKQMRNPTYMLVVNLSICDAVTLVSVAVYCGITILLDHEHATLTRWMTAVAMSGWYTNCLLFAYISFSRWIAITRSHLVDQMFTRNVMRFLHASAWVPVSLLCLYMTVILDPPLLLHYRKMFSWGFNVNTRPGLIAHWINFSNTIIISIVEMIFNITSLIHVHKTRKQVQSILGSQNGDNRRREVKLLIQCFIIGCIFMMASVMFTLAAWFGWTSPVATLGTQAAWTFNHCVNPLIYFSVNTELRKNFWGFVSCGKCGKGSNQVGTV